MKNENINAEELYLSQEETSSTYATATSSEPVTVASYETSAPSLSIPCGCCPNISMETATEIPIGRTRPGCLCCPEAVQWYKITPNHPAGERPLYTIHSIGSTDVRGYLFRSNGVQIASNDEHIEGRGFFKMARRLTRGETYYLMVTGNGTNTGYFSVRVAKEKWPESVTVSPLSATLEIGNTLQLTSTVLPEDANNRDVLYTSDYESVATVHPTSGLVTAVGAGSTTIRVYDWKGRTRGAVCNITVEEIKVTSVTLDCSKRIMKPDDSDFLYATISPSNATNKKLHWYSDNSDVVEVDEDGYIYAVSDGTANITVETDDGGYTDTCTIIVDSREQVLIKKDSHSFYVKFEDGKTWKNIGIDLSNRQENHNLMYPPNMWYEYYDDLIEEEQRYVDNIYVEENGVIVNNSYSEKQIGFLYLLDPLGIEYYMRHNACQDMSLGETLFFKDKVYKEIFGVWPRLIKVFPDKSIQYYVYPSSISADTRADYYTDAEILFGEHPIYDILSLISFLLDVVPSVSLSLFSMFYPPAPAGVVLGSIELVKFLFFSASASGVLSSGTSSVMEEYTSNIYTLSGGESAGVKAGKAMGWVNFVLGTFSTILDATEVFTPSINDITTYNRINESDYRVNYNVSGSELSMADIISRIS